MARGPDCKRNLGSLMFVDSDVISLLLDGSMIETLFA